MFTSPKPLILTSSANPSRMNVPNLLTISRFFLCGILILFIYTPGILAKSLALSVFIIACLTDYWDGVLARKYNQITPLGQLLDPIADKVLIFGAFLSFVDLDVIPAWMVIVMLAREILITGFRLMAANQGVVIPARKSGKHKTVLQLVSIIVILCYLILREFSAWNPDYDALVHQAIIYFMYLVVAITIYSGIRFTAGHWKDLP